MKYVYLMRAGEEHYKVGIAGNVSKRLANIQSGNPRKVQLITARLVANALQVEKEMHQQLREMGADGGSEWFVLEPEEALTVAATLNQNPEIDVLPQIDLSKQIIQQERRHKALEKKIDTLINLHQSPAARARAGIRKQSGRAMTVAERVLPDRERALEVFQQEGRLSTSLLQRRLFIGYGRASRIMDELKDLGIIQKLGGNQGWEITASA